MKKLIALLLILSNPTWANGVVYLPKDTPAPYAGFLFTPEMEKFARENTTNLEFEKKQGLALVGVNQELHKTTDIMQSRIDNLTQQNDKLSDKLASNDNMFAKIGMFILGAGCATLLTFGVSRAVR